MPMRNFQEKWFFRELIDLPGLFQSGVGGYSIVAQTLFQRGITTLNSARGFLEPVHYNPAPPSELPGFDLAAERILAAIANSELILIWGDFDVDGQTSTTLLRSALSAIGARVIHYIPNRGKESHGISLDALKSQIDFHHPDLIITCDTGIDATQEIDYANQNSVDVIITDHHQLPETLPKAHSIINPALLDAGHPLADLPGVGVAYKLIEGLFGILDRDPTQFLDLVALGIVADVAQLSKDTRYLLQIGLPFLQQTSRLGLRLLYENAKLDPAEIGVDQIGFAIGPRLNALGRLSDANTCLEFFTSSDLAVVSNLADELEILNHRRQEITDQIYLESKQLLDNYPELDNDYPILVLLGPPDWNPGVVGIVASRLVERYHKPVIMLTEEGSIARGSARSIPGIGISDLISRSGSLLISHGGHPMAAGVSLKIENVSEFRRSLAKNYSHLYGDSVPAPEITIDGELPFQAINEEFITDLQRLAPYGSGNPKLLFATRNVNIVKDQSIGKNANHRKLMLSDSSGSKQEFLWWNSIDFKLPKGGFDIAYSLDLSNFRNQVQIQATLRHFRKSEHVPVYLHQSRPIEMVDHRKCADPENEIQDIIKKYASSLVWAEFVHPKGSNSVPRTGVGPAKNLIIWTSPPSSAILKLIIEKAQPERLFLFSIDPGMQSKKFFLESLSGLLKHVQETGKAYDPVLFAQRIAQTQGVIETGLDWLHHHGDLDLSLFRSENMVKIGTKEPDGEFLKIDKKLELMLQEIRAFRSYYQKADLYTLL